MAQAPTVLPPTRPAHQPAPLPPRRRSRAALPLLLTLLAFALRVSHLALESLDIDETDGAAFIAAGLPELVARLFRNGENGPLYYLVLHLWSLGAGTTEFALRFPSVLAGTVTVPLMYVVTRRLAGPRAALLGALLAATSSYLIHYAQMVKMYALVVALAALAAYAFLRALESGRVRWWAAYTAAVSVTFYTHIFGVLLIPWHTAVVVLRWRALPARTRRAWLASLGLLTLPYLPLGLWHLDNLRNIRLLTRQFTGARDFPSMIAELAGEYGARLEDAPRLAVAFLFVSLALLGLAALVRAPQAARRRAGWLLAAGVVLPVALIALLVAAGAPVYSPRYLIITYVPFLGLWAAGLAAALARRPALGIAGLAVALALNGAHLAQRDLAGRAFREDWRAAMGYIGLRAQPGDAILLMSSAAGNAFRYYGDAKAGMIDTEALRREAGDAGFVGALDAMAGRQRRLWLATAYFELPDFPRVQAWLSENTQYEREVWFRNIRVALHTPQPDPSLTLPPVQQPLAFTFGQQIALAGMDRGPVPARPGEPWQVRLVWRAVQQPETDLAVSLRVTSADGTVWGRSEGPPGGAFRPTSGWQPGQVIVDDRDVALTPGMPPGDYRVGLYVYRRDTVTNLPVAPAQDANPTYAPLGTFRLDTPLPVNAGLLPVPLPAEFAGGLRLLGAETLPERVAAGDAIPVALVYDAGSQPPAGLAAEVTIEDAAGRTAVVEQPLVPADAAAAPAPSGPVAQRLGVSVPLRFAGGAATLRLLVKDAGGALPRRQWGVLRTRDPLRLGAVETTPRAYRQDLPRGLEPRQEQFGDGVTLAGTGPIPAEVQRGRDVAVRLVWQAAGEPVTRWTASVQLLDGTGRLAAQADRPIGGGIPSDGWIAGEVTEDTLNLVIGPDVPAGDYRLALVLYRAADGVRLRTPDGRDAIELTRLRVHP